MISVCAASCRLEPPHCSGIGAILIQVVLDNGSMIKFGYKHGYVLSKRDVLEQPVGRRSFNGPAEFLEYPL